MPKKDLDTLNDDTQLRLFCV